MLNSFILVIFSSILLIFSFVCFPLVLLAFLSRCWAKYDCFLCLPSDHWAFYQKITEIFTKQFAYCSIFEFSTWGVMIWESLFFFIFLKFLCFILNISLSGYPFWCFGVGSCWADDWAVLIPWIAHEEIVNCCVSYTCLCKRKKHLKYIIRTNSAWKWMNERKEDTWKRKKQRSNAK